MGRRADHSREELYDLSLQAARRIVENDGHRALTARHVADAIGYSAGTLYNIFENLDDLIVHLNGRLLDEMYDVLSSLPVTGDAEQNVRRLLRAYFVFIESRSQLWALLFEHSLPDGRFAPDWYHRKVDKVLGVLERAIAPSFAPEDRDGPRRSARVLWASLHGIWSLGSSGKLDLLTTESVTQLAETLITTYLAGLGARGGRSS